MNVNFSDSKTALFRIALLTVVALSAAGCGELETMEPVTEVEPNMGVVTSPIRFGTDDGDGHPGIMKLHIRVGNSGFLCSGTVIEQRTILTAAHCVENAAAASDIYVALDTGYQSAAQFYIHEDYSADAPHIRNVNGEWFRFSGPDIAIVTFAQDLPAPVVSIGTDAPAAGDLLTIVGYGANENNETGVRRVGTVEFAAVTETYEVNQSTVHHAEGSLVVNPGPTNQVVCGGDSGGALLVGDDLVGVTSGGVVAVGDDNPCVRARSANFISAAAYLDWIESKVTLPTNSDVEIADELLCTAYQLDSAQAFITPPNFSTTWGGRGEKWFQNAQREWHFILPEGDVYKWTVGSTPPMGEQVGSLAPIFHEDPSRLTEAVEPEAQCEQAAEDSDSLAQTAYDLDQTYEFSFNGSYATNWAGRGEKWIVGGNSNWFFILPNGTVNRWTNNARPVIGEVIGTLSPDFHADPSRLHDAPVPGAGAGECADESPAATAYALDQAQGFRFTGSYAENWGGHGEKWFQNNASRWFYILPNGEIYKWTTNTTPAQGTLIDTLTSAYHTDPSLLIDAQAPEAGSCEADDLSAQAADLDAMFGFRASNTYNQNWGGQDEKWFTNENNNWFYIVPNGTVYRWQAGSRPLVGTEIVVLNATYYANPALLHDAAE
jgi:V8-like Glu-specific endopeptidase